MTPGCMRRTTMPTRPAGLAGDPASISILKTTPLNYFSGGVSIILSLNEDSISNGLQADVMVRQFASIDLFWSIFPVRLVLTRVSPSNAGPISTFLTAPFVRPVPTWFPHIVRLEFPLLQRCPSSGVRQSFRLPNASHGIFHWGNRYLSGVCTGPWSGTDIATDSVCVKISATSGDIYAKTAGACIITASKMSALGKVDMSGGYRAFLRTATVPDLDRNVSPVFRSLIVPLLAAIAEQRRADNSTLPVHVLSDLTSGTSPLRVIAVAVAWVEVEILHEVPGVALDWYSKRRWLVEFKAVITRQLGSWW